MLTDSTGTMYIARKVRSAFLEILLDYHRHQHAPDQPAQLFMTLVHSQMPKYACSPTQRHQRPYGFTVPCPPEVCDCQAFATGLKFAVSPRRFDLAGLSREPVVAGPRVSQQRGLCVLPVRHSAAFSVGIGSHVGKLKGKIFWRTLFPGR